MRRIVVVAVSHAGVSAGVEIKRRLPEHEVNVVVPSSGDVVPAPGSFAERFFLTAPGQDKLVSQGVGGLEANDIMTDFSAKEITVSSARGRLPVRYTDLVLEVAAEPRLPRGLQKSTNVLRWLLPSFGGGLGDADAVFAKIQASDKPILVVGGGAEALDALLFVCGIPSDSAKAQEIVWLRTKEEYSPELDPHLAAYCLSRLRDDVSVISLPDTPAESLAFAVDGDALNAVTLPDGTTVECGGCVWASFYMGRHPVLREEGVTLDPLGRIAKEEGADPALVLMGSGAAVPAATAACANVTFSAFAGEENALVGQWAAIDNLIDPAPESAGTMPVPGAFGVRGACAHGVRFRRAGLTVAEAERQGREAVLALAVAVAGKDFSYDLLSCDSGAAHSAAKSATGEDAVLLSLVCDRTSRTILGAQVLGFDRAGDIADGVFGMALSAVQSETPLYALQRRSCVGVAGQVFAEALSLLSIRLDTILNGISPDELLASKEAGASFFTLDLRSKPDWEAGHVPDAYNIPLPQLKKRLQNEVPHMTPLVIVSSDGRDACDVAFHLAGLGAKDLYVLDGGMAFWPYGLEK